MIPILYDKTYLKYLAFRTIFIRIYDFIFSSMFFQVDIVLFNIIYSTANANAGYAIMRQRIIFNGFAFQNAIFAVFYDKYNNNNNKLYKYKK